MANVASDDAGLETSVVVEGTRAGTVLIGASRERVGFDRTMSLPVLRRLAAQAVGLFPFLAEVNLLRSYLGFRPYCPDHLPVIGPDPRVPGLVHACGHEGAGIGLSAATGSPHRADADRAAPDLDLTPFRPGPVRDGGRGMSTFSFDGREIVAEPGQSVGAALIAAGYRSWRTTRHGGAPRGVFCGIGICFDCLVVVNGRPNQRACLTEVRDGDEVEPQEGTGHEHLAC